MKLLSDKRLIKFYLWLALGYFFMGILSTHETYPANFFPIVFNNLWAIVYLTVLNFILFEYSVPFVLRKRKVIVYNILLGILLLE